MNDPYSYNDHATLRLMKEYYKHKKLIVAVDFDETVFDTHSKGYTFDRVFQILDRCQKLGFHLVIFTASEPERYPMMLEYYSNKGVKIDSINKNPVDLPYGNHGKIYYNILLDDRAGLGQAMDVLETVLSYAEAQC